MLVVIWFLFFVHDTQASMPKYIDTCWCETPNHIMGNTHNCQVFFRFAESHPSGTWQITFLLSVVMKTTSKEKTLVKVGVYWVFLFDTWQTTLWRVIFPDPRKRRSKFA
jgi:hypothetical protein